MAYRLDVVVHQHPKQRTHGLHVIIDAAKQHRLVADADPFLVEALAGLAGDPRDLVGMVEVRMQSHALSLPARLAGNGDERVEPAVATVEEAGRPDGEAL